jgi:hypothetical protein
MDDLMTLDGRAPFALPIGDIALGVFLGLTLFLVVWGLVALAVVQLVLRS